MLRRLLSLIGLCFCLVSAACQSTLTSNVEQALANPEHTGIRWGIVVADMDGTELFSLQPDARFTPASNTKIITTMATYHHLSDLEEPALNPGTRVFIEFGDEGALPNLILEGGGDAMLSDTADCETTCLSHLADQVAATGATAFGSVIGDDTLFPFERWGPGWSVEDLQFYYGTAISALSVNDNLVWVDIKPGDSEGTPAIVDWQNGDTYLKLDNQITTSAAGSDRELGIERYPGAQTVRLYGTVPAAMETLSYGLAIENPAEYAALRFKRLLEVRGIAVQSTATRHRPLELSDLPPEPDSETATLVSASQADISSPIAQLPPSPLALSLRRISKDSENLHADIALRRLGLLEGTGSRAYGVAAVEQFLNEAGLPAHGYALHGGSGMSIYNRISPRSLVQLLNFAAQQAWFEAWLADQPIGGVDGSLERRFKGTLLEGKIFAKTGTLNGANALSGVMIAQSGRELLFSIIANDRPASTGSARPEMDAALNVIAEAY